jgi:predicted nucleic acid-binding protein
MAYLLDSAILIDHFNGIAAAIRLLPEHRHDIAISVITRAEALAGFAIDREPPARLLLDRIPVYPVTSEDADLAVIAETAPPEAARCLQAAITLNRQLERVTRNPRDFNPARHAVVHVPYTLNDKTV